MSAEETYNYGDLSYGKALRHPPTTTDPISLYGGEEIMCPVCDAPPNSPCTNGSALVSTHASRTIQARVEKS